MEYQIVVNGVVMGRFQNVIDRDDAFKEYILSDKRIDNAIIKEVR